MPRTEPTAEQLEAARLALVLGGYASCRPALTDLPPVARALVRMHAVLLSEGRRPLDAPPLRRDPVEAPEPPPVFAEAAPARPQPRRRAARPPAPAARPPSPMPQPTLWDRKRLAAGERDDPEAP